MDGTGRGSFQVGIAIRDSVTSTGRLPANRVTHANRYPVSALAGEPLTTVGPCPGDAAIRMEIDSPHALVDHVVMTRAQRNEIVEIGWPTLFPGCDMVDLTVLEPDRAVRVDTGAMYRSQRPPLGSSSCANSGSDVKWFSGTA